MSSKNIEQVLNEKQKEWLSIPGVTGAAIGSFRNKPCVKIYTAANPRKLRDQLPSNVEGYPVIIEQTGQFHSLDQI